MDAIGLFDNARETNLESTVGLVENTLITLGYYLNECRIEPKECFRAWRIQQGSAAVEISILDHGEVPQLRAVAAVMTVTSEVDTNAL